MPGDVMIVQGAGDDIEVLVRDGRELESGDPFAVGQDGVVDPVGLRQFRG